MLYTMAPAAQSSLFWAFNENNTPCRCCNPSEAIEYGMWTCSASGCYWIISDGPVASWADIAEEDEARLTDAQIKAKAAAAAEETRLRILTAEASRMFNYAEEQKILNMKGKGQKRAIGKVNEPCRWLYCDEKAHASQWTVNAKGERCAPVRMALTGAECWAHEYHHPKTKALAKPHTCKRLHPGEAGWLDIWNTNRTHKPSVPTKTDNFFAARLKTQAW